MDVLCPVEFYIASFCESSIAPFDVFYLLLRMTNAKRVITFLANRYIGSYYLSNASFHLTSIDLGRWRGGAQSFEFLSELEFTFVVWGYGS